MTDETPLARRAHKVLEPLHTPIYFAPEGGERYTALGIKGGMRGGNPRGRRVLWRGHLCVHRRRLEDLLQWRGQVLQGDEEGALQVQEKEEVLLI